MGFFMALKRKRPKPIAAREVSTIAMVNGNENRIREIIHDKAVKQWVGIGWITVRHAELCDYLTIPEIK